MDQRQNSIEPGERFRAGKHTEGVSNHNPALRPHGVVDEAELAKAPVRWVVLGMLPPWWQQASQHRRALGITRQASAGPGRRGDRR